jgi:3-hydroxyisobutyrate dehydrogenase
MADAPRITLLGTGTMGVGMARSILRAGLPLTVWNRHVEKARPLAEDGARVAEDLTEAVRDADVVVTMLFDADAVAEVMEQAAGAMREGAVWVQSATVGRNGIARLARLAEEHGLTIIDAPMVGTKRPAEEGALTVLAAGAPASRDTVQPVFDAVGAKTVWLGDEPGPASAMKLVANSWVAMLTAGTAQGIQQARAFGLDPGQFLETVAGGSTDTPYLQTKGRAILEGRFEPQFGLDGLLKDLRLIRAATADAGVPTTVVDALVDAFARASDEGHGREDIAAVAVSFSPPAAAPAV